MYIDFLCVGIWVYVCGCGWVDVCVEVCVWMGRWVFVYVDIEGSLCICVRGCMSVCVSLYVCRGVYGCMSVYV